MTIQRERELNAIQFVELLQHDCACSVDAAMLDFLQHGRLQQPSRKMLENFFPGKIWPADVDQAGGKLVAGNRVAGKLGSCCERLCL